ncbi:MAG: DNA-directed RNA polymerase subunit beta' [Candidatus Stahlbacteria bacterium]|nr:DNA-directed RNA polymerase subunit beta' [Candidatus Stahlbacteria bacterium]
MKLKAIQVGIASPDTIRSWSKGEVKKAETINYRTQKPEYDGLFCERIFGPIRDYECSCGKYKGIRYKGIICERCKVEITLSRVRRERLGHIELSIPVAHIWFYRVPPSKIGAVLDLSVTELERLIYYESHVVISPGTTEYKRGDLLTDQEYKSIQSNKGFVAKTGAEALLELLKDIDMEELSTEIKQIIRIETSVEKRSRLLKRLNVIEGFCSSRTRPDWMVLRVLPVLPPDLRPLVPLEGGRYATSDLNDLYRRVIMRNNRLKNLIQIRAPEIILKNECRLLQESVDALFDNTRRSVPVKGKGRIPLKSLSDTLKGKQGRFRRNLLGKRVDYSGRSVIAVDPDLKLYECGVPKTMALELFKPFVIRELEREGYAQTVKGARKLLEEGAKEVWETLERIIYNHPVLLNRAPTLHRLSIQAFLPKLVEGKALRISPLVCVPFNADFDGDTMAIHVPLSVEAQLESLLLMMASNNILSPSNGEPISTPTQDAIIGIYWLTKERPKKDKKQETAVKAFSNIDEIEMAVEYKSVTLHEYIKYRVNGKLITTTPGRVIFNKVVPEEIEFVNELVGKKQLVKLVGEIYRVCGNIATVKFLDAVKSIGYEYITRSGLTIGIDDTFVPVPKPEIIARALKEIEKVHNQHKAGSITESERYNTVIDIWMRTTNQIERSALRLLEEKDEGFNPVYMIVKSGSRGNPDQVRQIIGTRGLMTRPKGGNEIIETPITSNFREGLNVLEYFISTHGARKGLTDTALKTAQAGYLTRKLVDAAQNVVITEEDCGTIMGNYVGPIKEGEQIIEPISKRIKGRYAMEDVINPITSQVIVFGGQEIPDDKAQEIEECGIDKVYVRSVLTCESSYGICQKCYGRDLSTNHLVEIGESVGVIAAQSIGEPGTQLTLRTFHIGGIATRIAKESEMRSAREGKTKFENLLLQRRKDDTIVAMRKGGKIYVQSEEGTTSYKVPYGAMVKVKDNAVIQKGEILFEWDPYSSPLLSEVEGEVRYEGLVENETYRLEYDDRTSRKYPVVISDRKTQSELQIYEEEKLLKGYPLPSKAHILVPDGTKVFPGDLLAKIPREIAKTRDITGGLPRVVELFEARCPKEKAILTEIDGVVEFKPKEHGYRVIAVRGTNEEKKYRISYGRHLLVDEGEEVRAGDKITQGPVDPHDILHIKGVGETQEFLVNQIQEVYMLQGVEINDKHIGILVRQMLSKIRILDPGDTLFVEGQIVEKSKLMEENKRLAGVEAKGATYEPVLLGVTQAILATDSFISAASFQETTRVLTDAAIHRKCDYLFGIKENVIIGSLIPAGTGVRGFKVPENEVKNSTNVTVEVENPVENPAAGGASGGGETV